METQGLYSTARGVESAIKDAAKKVAQADPSLDVNKRIQLEYFNRLLSRVFSEGEGSQWVLKGGAGMLARIPSTRSTRDIDLYRQGFTLDQALNDLRRLATIDLGDHFRFEYAGHESSIAADAQPYTDGCRVTFDVFIGVVKKGKVQIDLAVGASMTDEVQISLPATTLGLPRLASHRTACIRSWIRSRTKFAPRCLSLTAAHPVARRISSTSWYSPLRRTSTALR